MSRLLQTFLTIIAGAVVAVIAWTVVGRFLHIVVLLIISLVLAYLITPLVGVELGGIGAAFLAVPLAGVLWVLAVALYADATGQTELLVRRARRASASPTTRGRVRRPRGPTRQPLMHRSRSKASN